MAAMATAVADTAGSSWDDVLSDELKVQDEFCADVESCDVVRTPSDGDSSATASCHSSQRQPCTWWAVVLKAAGRELGYTDCETDPPSSQSGSVRLVSACSGCSAESWAMKGLGIGFHLLAACDTNADYRQFVRANFPGECKHLFLSLEDQLTKGTDCEICSNNRTTCEHHDASLPVDILVTGSPCDPFSKYRYKRFSDGSVKHHADYQTTMTTVVTLYQTYQPNVAIMEQVMGFLMPLQTGSKETPCQRQGSATEAV
ncbi:unnamed protein product [Symbiodinium sp. CCMP2456]|nr:unnamed protein product [Symbiodinium sp. CCMP2456]